MPPEPSPTFPEETEPIDPTPFPEPQDPMLS